MTVTLAAAMLLAGAVQAEELTHIKLGILKLGAMTNVWLATKNGIFKNHGLDVELVEISLSSQTIAVLQSKSVDIVLQIPGTGFVAKEQGFDIVLVQLSQGFQPPLLGLEFRAAGAPQDRASLLDNVAHRPRP